MRLFISIDPPADIQDQIAALQFYDKAIRWCPVEQIHLTLAFLGEHPENAIDDICEALSRVELEPFDVRTADAGCFHHGALWLGVEENATLMSLQKKVVNTLKRQGISFQSRRFHPHITVGRSKVNPAEAVEQLQARLNHQSFEFTVGHFVLKSSQLHSTGAVHTSEAEFYLD